MSNEHTIADKAVILTPANMHAAFDPNGTEVYCNFAGQPAMTNDGFCQYCGKTDHQPIATAAEPASLTADQATAQIKAWFAAGLPEGFIAVREPFDEIAVLLDTYVQVAIWAAALGRRAELGSDGSWMVMARPVDLPGWCLEVYTTTKDHGQPSAPIRIEVLP